MGYILILLGVLIMAFFFYTIYCNYKQEQEIERRKKISHYKSIISEIDELLLNAVHVPYTKVLVLMLQNRILFALTNILECNPGLNSIRTRIADIKTQIEFVNQNYKSGEDNPFIAPNNDRQAIQMLKVISRLRKVARIEHNRGKIDPKAYITEDHRLELLMVKVNIASLMTHIKDCHVQRQWGTAKQLISKTMALLKSVSDKDTWLESRETEVKEINDAINKELSEINKKELIDIEKKEDDGLDEIFQDKKKW
ncbi:MAG: DNA repair protein [Succinivibrionaceae bacterium]